MKLDDVCFFFSTWQMRIMLNFMRLDFTVEYFLLTLLEVRIVINSLGPLWC